MSVVKGVLLLYYSCTDSFIYLSFRKIWVFVRKFSPILCLGLENTILRGSEIQIVNLLKAIYLLEFCCHFVEVLIIEQKQTMGDEPKSGCIPLGLTQSQPHSPSSYPRFLLTKKEGQFPRQTDPPYIHLFQVTTVA